MRRGVDRGKKIGNVFTKIGARLIGEREGEEGSGGLEDGKPRQPKKELTSDRETPARPIKGNDIFIIEINCRSSAARSSVQ